MSPNKKKGIFMPMILTQTSLLNLLFQRYGNCRTPTGSSGFDNSPISEEAVLPISTVGQQISVIAQKAMELLSLPDGRT